MNVGDVVLVRISGEPVYVDSIQEDTTGTVVGYTVRRALQTENGIKYVTEGFKPGELHTVSARMREEMDQQLEYRQVRKHYDTLALAADRPEVTPEQPKLFC